MNIVEAIKDENLLRPFFGDTATWKPWLTALRAVYGIPIASRQGCSLVCAATGLEAGSLPRGGFSTALFLTGRRSGKSRIAATIAAFEAVLAGHQKKLSVGERGYVPVLAPSKAQGRIVKDYLRAIFNLPLFANELAAENEGGFTLRDGTRIEVMAGNFNTVRGYTLLAAVVDEVCFFGYEESKISDTELIRALKPALATTGGKLIAISSPYARRGWAFNQHKRWFGNPAAKTLVWNAPSTTMNSTLPQSVVDEAMAEDPQAAKSEYGGEFRDDVAAFITREVVENLVAAGCQERLPRPRTAYVAFADLSGGRADDAALGIAHTDGRKVILDYVRRWKPPFDPRAVIEAMAEELRRYDIKRVTGDNYAAQFVAGAFEGSGIRYTKAELPKSALYIELLPRLCSEEISLLDNPLLVDQIVGLERRTRAGGKDIIDHPQNGHDDLANVVAGVAQVAVSPRRRIGAIPYN